MKNREIKFRALRFNGNGWAIGSLISPNVKDNMSFIIGWNGVRFVVKTETVCEFTGLKDKNGKDIYEGDIVKYMPKYNQGDAPIFRIEKVFWQDFRSGWATKRSELANNDLFRCAQYGNDIEVIGNIHENHELLNS